MIAKKAARRALSVFCSLFCATNALAADIVPRPIVGEIAGAVRIPARVAIVMSAEERARVYAWAGYRLNIGTPLENTLLQALAQVFDSVCVVPALPAPSDVGEEAALFVEPRVDRFQLSQSLFSLSQVRCEMAVQYVAVGTRRGVLVEIAQYRINVPRITVWSEHFGGSFETAIKEAASRTTAAAARGLVEAMSVDDTLARFVREHFPAPSPTGASPVFSMTSFDPNRLSIAVLDLRPLVVTADEATILTDRLRIEMARLGRFQVIERERMAELLQEHSFQQSGLCDTERCYLELGHLVGANAVVVGSVGKVGRTYTVTARMIDVETGEILAQAAYDCPCEVDALLTNMQRIAQGLAGTGQ